MPSVLPDPAEVPSLVPPPGSPVRRAAGDVRSLSTAGYALLLQVAHPTVGAGVGEYSGFLDDPWGRLLRTLDYVHGSIFGGPRLAAEIGARVRGIHRSIKGTRPDGTRYHALEPEAYAWVHATLASALVDGQRGFGRALTAAEAEQFWADWRRLGRLIGVRERDLPGDWGGFRSYFDGMVVTELVDNPTVHLVLEALARPAPPALPGVPPALWRVVRRPLAGQAHLMTVGMLPPVLRSRLQLEWSGRQERAFRALAAASRASSPVIVGPLREFGAYYVKWRRAALERGDVAAAPPQRLDRPRVSVGAG